MLLHHHNFSVKYISIKPGGMQFSSITNANLTCQSFAGICIGAIDASFIKLAWTTGTVVINWKEKNVVSLFSHKDKV